MHTFVVIRIEKRRIQMVIDRIETENCIRKRHSTNTEFWFLFVLKKKKKILFHFVIRWFFHWLRNGYLSYVNWFTENGESISFAYKFGFVRICLSPFEFAGSIAQVLMNLIETKKNENDDKQNCDQQTWTHCEFKLSVEKSTVTIICKRF